MQRPPEGDRLPLPGRAAQALPGRGRADRGAAQPARRAEDRARCKTLKGAHVAFTGILTRKRSEADRGRARAGATVHGSPSARTNVVVRGRPNPLQAAGRDGGRKLLEIKRLREKGQKITLLDEKQFWRLASRRDAAGAGRVRPGRHDRRGSRTGARGVRGCPRVARARGVARAARGRTRLLEADGDRLVRARRRGSRGPRRLHLRGVPTRAGRALRGDGCPGGRGCRGGLPLALGPERHASRSTPASTGRSRTCCSTAWAGARASRTRSSAATTSRAAGPRPT